MTSGGQADLITLAEARYLALRAQHLEHGERRSRKRPEKSKLLQVIDDSGCLQLDSISVVARAHETAMWSRVGSYKPADLSALHHPDLELIEYWAHAASLVPVAFLPHFRRQMAKYADPESSRWAKWGVENKELVTEVLETVERLGPVSTRAFERPEGLERSPWAWFGGKPAKEALDYLWTTGELIVHRRVGFERIYELTDRAFPGLRSQPLPEPDEEARFFISRALRAVGVGTPSWISDFFRAGTSRYVSTPDAILALEAMEREGSAIRVALEGMKGDAWLDPGLVGALADFRAGRVRPVTNSLLTPFDNLMWRRDRAFALFGMDYRIECYTPEPKRIYGYYTLPILAGGKLVGRVDPRYRRKEKLLSIQAIHLEPGVRPSQALAKSTAGALRAFTDFMGGGRIEVLASNPESFLPVIRDALG